MAMNPRLPGRDLDLSPGKEEVRVVTLLLRKLAHTVYELEGFAKVGEREGLCKVVFFDDAPTVHLLFEGGELRALEGWDAATAWDTGFGC
jgi:hypothetical protein